MDLLDDFDGDDFVDSGGVATITKKDKMHSRKQGKCIAPPGSKHPRDELIEDLTNPDLGGSEGPKCPYRRKVSGKHESF